MKLFIILFFPFSVLAHYHIETITPETIINPNTDGIASALALGQCNFDYSHFLQGCIAVGFHDGTQAGAVALGKKLGDDMLINGGIAFEEGGEMSGGAAINFKFK